MMEFKQYQDVQSFYEDAYPILMGHEAQNLIPLGNLIIGHAGKDKTGWRDPADWFMATVSDQGGIRLTALMTPPWNITPYATNNEINSPALSALVQGILDRGINPPGVLGEAVLAQSFAESYCAAKGISYHIHTRMRQYELKQVNPAVPQIGTLRLAEEKDLAFLPYWVAGFQHDCHGKPSTPDGDPQHYRYQIDTGRLFILELEGTPVSMAMMNREMQSVCGLSQVYTPPYFRGKGYASSCVAALSQKILDRGYTSSVLYTDLDNPTSNSIYQKIGYVPICDSLDIRFSLLST